MSIGRALTAVSCLMVLCAPCAGAWSGTPIILSGPSATRLEVAADAAFGAFVLYQTSQGALHLTHIDAAGQPSASLPLAGLTLGLTGVQRESFDIHSDGLGGAYAWWMEQSHCYMTRVTPTGIAPGWTARGKSMGTLMSAWHRPWVEPDGSGGVWIGTLFGVWDPPLGLSTVRVRHLGPDGLGFAGWPATGRTIATQGDPLDWIQSASFARALDGGLWVLLACGSIQADTVGPGRWRLVRLTASGQRPAGEPVLGHDLGAHAAERLGFRVPWVPLGAVVADPDGGVMTLETDFQDDGIIEAHGWSRVQRRLANGDPHPLALGPVIVGNWFDLPSRSDLQILRLEPRFLLGPTGDLFVVTLAVASEEGVFEPVHSLDWSGALGSRVARGGDLDLGVRGGLWVGSYKARGPTSNFDQSSAGAYAWRSGQPLAYLESRSTYFQIGYFHAAIAALPDGGAMFCFSRPHAVPDSNGVYLVRLGAEGGAVSTQSPAAAARRLVARWRDSELCASFEPGSEGRLSLHDLAGRRVGACATDRGVREARLRPARRPFPGLYFARLERPGGVTELSKVLVTR